MLKGILYSIGVVVAMSAVLGLAVACGDSDDGGEPAANGAADDALDGTASMVDVLLLEWSVEPEPDTVPAGDVTFEIENAGAIVHDLKVIRTDLQPDALPIDESAFVVDEDQVDVVATSSDLEAGQSETVTATLESGNYVLICNIPTHYDTDMFIGFTVE